MTLDFILTGCQLLRRTPACRVGPLGAPPSEIICGDKIGNIYYRYHYRVPCNGSPVYQLISNQFAITFVNYLKLENKTKLAWDIDNIEQIHVYCSLEEHLNIFPGLKTAV